MPEGQIPIDPAQQGDPQQLKQQQPPEQLQPEQRNPYVNTFFTPLKPGESPSVGDIITFIYNKKLTYMQGPTPGYIHDKKPLLLVLNWKNFDRGKGINLHYLPKGDVTSLAEMVNRHAIYSYSQVKALNVRWTKFFRCYLYGWILPGTIWRMNPEAIQVEAAKVRETGLRNLETMHEMVKEQLNQKTKQPTAQQLSQPIKPTGSTPGTSTVPAIRTGSLNTSV